MKKAIRYAALNMSIPAMMLLLVMFAGGLIEGGLSRGLCAGVCLVLVAGIRAAWNSIRRMERVARQEKRAAAIARAARRRRAAALAAQAQGEAIPALRVA